MVILRIYHRGGRVSQEWACPTRELAERRVRSDAEPHEVQALLRGPGVHVVMVRDEDGETWWTRSYEAA